MVQAEQETWWNRITVGGDLVSLPEDPFSILRTHPARTSRIHHPFACYTSFWAPQPRHQLNSFAVRLRAGGTGTKGAADFAAQIVEGDMRPTTTLVTGGTGVLGRQVVDRLQEQGLGVRILSRRGRPVTLPPGTEWAQADLASGAGLAEALAGVQVVVHGASSPAGNTDQVDVQGTGRLLQAAAAGRLTHFVYISIVGIDRIPLAYYRSKLAAEGLVRQSGTPCTILRATQFHDFVDRVLTGAGRLPIMPLPAGFRFQPVDSAEVAQALAACVTGEPAGRLSDMGGPEVLSLRQLAGPWLAARGLRRLIVPIYLPGRVAYGYRQGYNSCPTNRQGHVTWRAWLERRYGAGPR